MFNVCVYCLYVLDLLTKDRLNALLIHGHTIYLTSVLFFLQFSLSFSLFKLFTTTLVAYFSLGVWRMSSIIIIINV